MTFKAILFISVLSVGMLSCSNVEKKAELKTEKLDVQEPSNEKKEDNGDTIKNNTFMGIKPADRLEDHLEKLQTVKIRDGETVKDVLVLEVDGQELGYAVPNREDKRLVGTITIQSPKVITDKGIHVGSTLGDALKKYPDLNLRKTKKGKKLYVKSGSIAFLLDYNNQAKEIKLSNIPLSTSIVEIKLLTENSSN